MKEKTPINYLYFGLFFFILSFLHVYHILLIQDGDFYTTLFFAVSAAFQIFLEMVCLLIIGRLLPRPIHNGYVAVTFLFFLCQIFDFPFIRIMDMSIWYIFGWLLDESLTNFLELLYASNIAVWTWFTWVGFFLLLPTAVVIFFKKADSVSKQYPVVFSQRGLLSLGAVCLVLLGSWDSLLPTQLPIAARDERFQKALPLKTTLFPPAHESIDLASNLKALVPENEVAAAINERSVKCAKRPNIFLFIAESIREDFMTAEGSPNLFQFKNANISFDQAFSNGNYTQNSWFSLFYSKFPFYWGKVVQSDWKMGSVPLNILKKMGYKIHVYTSIRLGFYQMDKMLFGENAHLADDIFFYPHGDGTQAYESDEKCLKKLQEVMDVDDGEGHVHIVLLDATHFDYSWPTHLSSRFTPVAESIDYLKAALFAEEMDMIKNRYRNAIYFVDTLFGNFMTSLKAKKWGDEAVVVFTADHGEEFFEHGHLFHASDLCKEQTNVPIYYKLGSGQAPNRQALSSHMDIFPTILHHVAGSLRFSDLLEGESILAGRKWPYVVSARYNASRAPYEFFIHNGKCKLMARFANEKEIFASKKLHLLSTKGRNDEKVTHTPRLIHEEFGSAFDRLFP